MSNGWTMLHKQTSPNHFNMARGLAALGRGPDNTLVHMSNQELAGLKQLAHAAGGQLTTNPHTGLPEAGFLSGLLPAIAGGLTALIPGVGPWAAPMVGAAVGGADSAINHQSILTGMGLGALGGFGGGNIAGELGGLGGASGAAAEGSSFGANASQAGSGLSNIMGGGAKLGALGYGNLAMAAAPAVNNYIQGNQAKMPTQSNEYYRTKFNAGSQQPGGQSQGQLPLTGQGYGPGTYSPTYNYGATYASGGIASPSPAPSQISSTPIAMGSSAGINTLPNQTALHNYYSSLLQTPSNAPGAPPPPDAMNNYLNSLQASLTPQTQTGKPTTPTVATPTQPTSGIAGLGALSTNAANGATSYDPTTQTYGTPSGAGQLSSSQLQQLLSQYGGGFSMGMAGGGVASLPPRFLRGPGDGVSDSIPADLGGQKAALADGEFIVPARHVSELGNGSSEAGARKLYAMMDRIQKKRGKTLGDNFAEDSKADQEMPA